MAYPAADTRRVYLACRPIFAGNNALLRKTKKIRELVSLHETSLRPLLHDLPLEKIVDITRSLLEKQIFQSDVKAKIEFPELFFSSPVRDVQRAASENDAARSAAEALEEVASQEQEDGNDSDDEGLTHDVADVRGSSNLADVPETDKSMKVQESAKKPSGNNNISLYPMYFPYHTQHAILSKVQSVLEESCFEFTQTWQPSILEERGWDCAAAVELTKWTRLFAKQAPKFPQYAFKRPGGGDASPPSSLNEILFATHKLRHTAVHRLPTPCRGVEALIKSAISLTETLQDTLRTAQLEDLRLEIDSKIKAMELNKNVLEETLSRELQQIQRQREELDAQEKTLAERIIREDRENKALIGTLLEDSVSRLFVGAESNVNGSLDDADQVSDGEEKQVSTESVGLTPLPS